MAERLSIQFKVKLTSDGASLDDPPLLNPATPTVVEGTNPVLSPCTVSNSFLQEQLTGVIQLSQQELACTQYYKVLVREWDTIL